MDVPAHRVHGGIRAGAKGRLSISVCVGAFESHDLETAFFPRLGARIASPIRRPFAPPVPLSPSFLPFPPQFPPNPHFQFTVGMLPRAVR